MHIRIPRFAGLVIALGCFVAGASAQTTSEITLKPWTDPTFGETVDKVLYQEQGHVKGEDDRGAQVFFWDSTGRFRFSKSDPNAFTLGYRYLTTNFDTNSPNVPDTLDDLSLAAGIHLGEMGGFKTSVVAGAGYSGDNLFADASGVYGLAHLILERPLNETDSLVLTLDYDRSSAFLPDVPLPGFAYVRRGESLSYALGFPESSVGWEISPGLRLDARYAVPFTGEVTLEKALGGGVSVFGNYTNFFNAFFQDNEPRENRLFYEMRRAEVGVRYLRDDIFRGMDLDLALVVGYAFDQQFSEGFDVRGRDPVAELSDEPYIGIVVRGTF